MRLDRSDRRSLLDHIETGAVSNAPDPEYRFASKLTHLAVQ